MSDFWRVSILKDHPTPTARSDAKRTAKVRNLAVDDTKRLDRAQKVSPNAPVEIRKKPI